MKEGVGATGFLTLTDLLSITRPSPPDTRLSAYVTRHPSLVTAP